MKRRLAAILIVALMAAGLALDAMAQAAATNAAGAPL